MEDSIRAALELALGLLPDEDLEILINAVDTSEREAGSIICREGSLEHVFYIIQEGTVAFTKKMDQGEQFLGLRGKGEFFWTLPLLVASASMILTSIYFSVSIWNASLKNPGFSLSKLEASVLVNKEADQK